MGLGKFLSNAKRAAGKATKVVTKTVDHVSKDVAHTAGNVASQVGKTVSHAASDAAVGVGKGIQTAGHGIGKVGIGKVNLGNATKALTHAGIGNVNLANASKELGKGISKVAKIPVLGPIVGITTGIHLVNAVNNVANGQRIDRAALGTLKSYVKDYKDMAPYVASVISFVPAIGPGVGAGIAAGAALADGKRWDEIAIEAAKGAIPGGNIAKAVFDASVAAARGKSLEQVGLAALPVNDKAKAAIAAGLALTKDLASGKRVDQALLSRVNDLTSIAGVKGQAANAIGSAASLAKDLAAGKDISAALSARVDDAMKIAAPEAMKALQIGTAIGTARKLQDGVMKQMKAPAALGALEDLGKGVLSKNPALAQGLKVSNNPAFKKGFAMASGIMSGKNVNEAMLHGLRDAMPPDAKKGFDTATAYIIGKHGVANKPPTKRNPPRKPGETVMKAATPTQSFAYYATHGLANGASVQQKEVLVRQMASDPEMRAGASDAIRAVAADRGSLENLTLWDKLVKFFTGKA